MGSYKDRGRRPFIWQDEMAEVKNLFRKVAKVKNSRFTGFSVWKDEPTAETLSKNRLRRRRSQYALDLTHLNYSESPYQALNHLHNIRGMCSRIQRQDLYVERKKKDYDADLHPSLLRRPITANSTCNAAGWDPGDRASLSRRPSSAPYSTGTPLHFTAPKPTVLYDATHKCARNRTFPKRPSSSVSTSRSGRSAESVRGAAWESSSAFSTPAHSSSFPSSTRTHSAGHNPSAGYRLNTDFALRDGTARQDGVTRNHSPRTATIEVEVVTSDLYSSGIETGSSCLSGSVLSMDPRPPSSRLMNAAVLQERPPSRLISKRPQQQQVDVPKPETRDGLASPVSSVTEPKSCRNNIQAGVSDCVEDSPCSTIAADVLTWNTLSRPFSSGRDKKKTPDRGYGLWALKQQQQRPLSADSVATGRFEDQKQRPSTSPSQAKANCFKPNHFPHPSSHGHSKVRFGCSTPTANKNCGRRDEIAAVQGCFDHELHQVLRSDESCSETDHSVNKKPENLPKHLSTSGANSCEDQTSSSTSGANEAHAASNDSHVLIKHSTDPYADFKTSMMHMINEEELIDKEWELEELFLYYMDLNPLVHHDILRRVISDIKKDLATEKAKAAH
ncbi:hypothetical protein Mapa_005554 [Marchantia paleacea]|nr:hypothetical protein Mapa_005554 [Marchantia paleacea]